MVVSQKLHVVCRAVERNALQRLSTLESDRDTFRARTLKWLQGAKEADQVRPLLIDDFRKGRHARNWQAIVQ